MPRSRLGLGADLGSRLGGVPVTLLWLHLCAYDYSPGKWWVSHKYNPTSAPPPCETGGKARGGRPGPPEAASRRSYGPPDVVALVVEDVAQRKRCVVRRKQGGAGSGVDDLELVCEHGLVLSLCCDARNGRFFVQNFRFQK